MPGSLNHQKGENMRIDRSYLGNQNTYAENNPKCIVVHNTDNFAAGADARAHARAQQSEMIEKLPKNEQKRILNAVRAFVG